MTGTGTGIGKTHVTAALIRALRAEARDVAALKPVISGFDPADLATSDTGILMEALGVGMDMAAVEAISPWRFAPPLSPDMAAAAEGRTLDATEVIDWCDGQVATNPPDRVLLIEGVGGAMVPLDGTATVRDWIAALDIPALVVAGSYLGTISHTLTTLSALREVNVPVAAVILSETLDCDIPLADTHRAVARHADDVPIFSIPWTGTHNGAAIDAIRPFADALFTLR